MPRVPGLDAEIVPAQPPQHRRDLLALARQILPRRIARPGQLAHRLVAGVGNPHSRQLAGAQELSQRFRVAPIGLHPVAGLLWNE